MIIGGRELKSSTEFGKRGPWIRRVLLEIKEAYRRIAETGASGFAASPRDLLGRKDIAAFLWSVRPDQNKTSAEGGSSDILLSEGTVELEAVQSLITSLFPRSRDPLRVATPTGMASIKVHGMALHGLLPFPVNDKKGRPRLAWLTP